MFERLFVMREEVYGFFMFYNEYLWCCKGIRGKGEGMMYLLVILDEI